MSMTRVLGIACLVAAGVLGAWAWDAHQSIGSEVYRFFRGTPTDRTLWLALGAGLSALAGVGLLLCRSKKK